MNTQNTTENATHDDAPMVGSGPLTWKWLHGHYLRFASFLDLGEFGGGGLLGFGIVTAELPNLDVEPEQRFIKFIIQDKSDYESLTHAQIDRGARDGTNELLLAYEYRRGLFGGRRPCLHVAAYPAGTWTSFLDAVSKYAAKAFRWPNALFKYQPSNTQVFPATENIFRPSAYYNG
jgi:hypothetical protein